MSKRLAAAWQLKRRRRRVPHSGWRSIPRCRPCVRPAASRSPIPARCAPPAGASCRSSRDHTASGWERRSLTTQALASFPHRRLPIHPPSAAPAPRRATMPHAGARLQVWRPHQPRPRHGALDGARRRRTSTDALIPCRCIGAAYGRGASIRRRHWRRRSSRLRRVFQSPTTSSGALRDPLAGRSDAKRARHECRGCIRAGRARQGVFAWQARRVGWRCVNLGATVDNCARVLLRGGALAVDVVIFARVVEPGRSPI